METWRYLKAGSEFTLEAWHGHRHTADLLPFSEHSFVLWHTLKYTQTCYQRSDTAHDYEILRRERDYVCSRQALKLDDLHSHPYTCCEILPVTQPLREGHESAPI